MIHRAFRTSTGTRPVVPRPSRELHLEDCYEYCKAIAGATRHNYPVGSTFVPAHLRRHIWAVYAFARVADDFADEPQYEGRRHIELDAWEDQLRSVYFDERPTHPVFVALADTIARFELPITELRALIAGFRLDLTTDRYARMDDLRNYIMLAAAPVGHLYLTMAGHSDPRLHAYADDLAVGLSLARLLQDITADLRRGRVYLPADDLYHFGVTVEDLRTARTSPAIDALIRFQVSRARAFLSRSRPLIDGANRDLGIELALIWHGSHIILERIERAGSRVLVQRPTLSGLDKARALTSSLLWRRGR
jgi:squalene synthase HpnC